MKNKVIICDLDGTLTESKQPLTPDMKEVLSKVLENFRLVVVSGASYKQFQNQFLAYANFKEEELKNLFLFPANGSAFYCHKPDFGWALVYDEKLTEFEKQEIYNAFDHAVKESGVEVFDVTGENHILEDRGGQITFSGRGQGAPLSIKKDWDPDVKKRGKILDILKKLLPNFEVRIGGSTSIDVTRKGIDKAYAIYKVQKELNVSKEDIIYIGDALFPGGNDSAALTTGVKCIQVSGPIETMKNLEDIVFNS